MCHAIGLTHGHLKKLKILKILKNK